MGKTEDLTGKRFGRLTVIEQVPNTSNHARWKCLCDCGNYTDAMAFVLKSGHKKSCGCLLHHGHGYSEERLYHVWVTMKQRCSNPNHNSFKNYGARGISVCDEWMHDYVAFRNWAIGNGYDENAERFHCTLDRIDVNGNYEPSNCRWVKDWSIQSQNRRPTKYASHHKRVTRISSDGSTVTFFSLREAARETTGNEKSAASISACCRGKRVSAYGYHWEFAAGGHAR